MTKIDELMELADAFAETADHFGYVRARSRLKSALEAALVQGKPYDQQAMELCDECGWKAVMPGEPCLLCRHGRSGSPQYRKAAQALPQPLPERASSIPRRQATGDCGMNHTEKLHILAEWQARIQTADGLIEPIADALGLSPESPIHTAVWSLQSAYTAAVAKLVGDHAEWLDWYAGDNCFGAKGMEAGLKDASRPIKTLEDLIWVMEVEA